MRLRAHFKSAAPPPRATAPGSRSGEGCARGDATHRGGRCMWCAERGGERRACLRRCGRGRRRLDGPLVDGAGAEEVRAAARHFLCAGSHTTWPQMPGHCQAAGPRVTKRSAKPRRGSRAVLVVRVDGRRTSETPHHYFIGFEGPKTDLLLAATSQISEQYAWCIVMCFEMNTVLASLQREGGGGGSKIALINRTQVETE